jgi:hypothetical protein
MTEPELKVFLMNKGIESCHLDNLVHDAASQLASNANNGGIEDQLNFLMNTCGWTSEDITNKL